MKIQMLQKISPVNQNLHLYENRRDPTRTLTLRDTFVKDISKRFTRIRGGIRKAIIGQDCFGLINPSLRLNITLPAEKAYKFLSSGDKINAFMEWLDEQAKNDILEVYEYPQVGSAVKNAWTNKYISRGYESGVLQARRKLIKEDVTLSGLFDEETGRALTEVFANPFHADRVGILFTRVFTDLKGITDAMDMQISRVLASGISDGVHPYKLAELLTKTISGPIGDLGITDTLGRFIPAQRRARMLARTEIIRAHAEATLQEYENWGVADVVVEAEWATGGFNVCPECQELEGQTFTIEEARGMLPRHPACKCSWSPRRKK